MNMSQSQLCMMWQSINYIYSRRINSLIDEILCMQSWCEEFASRCFEKQPLRDCYMHARFRCSGYCSDKNHFRVNSLFVSKNSVCTRLIAKHQSKSWTCSAYTRTRAHQNQQICSVEGCRIAFSVLMYFHSLAIHLLWMENLHSHLCIDAMMAHYIHIQDGCHWNSQ